MADAASLLALVEAAIEARLNGGAVESYAIRGRNLKYVPMVELMQMRTDLRREANTPSGDGLPVGYGVKDRRLASS